MKTSIAASEVKTITLSDGSTTEIPKERWTCPRCGARTSGDPSGKGWVDHLEYLGRCRDNPYGHGERD